eukprot:GFUD01006481.1.p1 GENE.GFUD01006481.1~~GFUD01006481.1.p1  ORF type:complete len:356 (-),score=94.78 GFUD01006481.1:45-1112(-)
MAISCCQSTPIPRVSSLSEKDFHDLYFVPAKPVIITDATEDWPARNWTIDNLVERVGDNEVWVRGKTNVEDYRVGKAYSIRRDTFSKYCEDLTKGNARARSSYLAVASMQQAFPQLLSDVPLPTYLKDFGKLHLGPYMWVALKGHYEFCHFDPDDNFLVMIRGRKQVRLFGTDLSSLYPNPLGSHGKTVQSQVNCDSPHLEKFPNFANAKCQYCTLQPGEMLFIPAFFWHQVNALDTGISLNMFYGDPGENSFISKMFHPPYQEHFFYWFLNIMEQNKAHTSFPKIISRLPEVVKHFFLKQWHETPTIEQVDRVVQLAMDHFKIDTLPSPILGEGKFPPVLKIRGLLHRDGNKTK